MLQLFFFYFTFAPAKEPKDLNLIIDIGNTKAKIAFFDGGEMVDVVAESNQSLGCLKALCSQYPVEQGIVATVIDLNEKVLADLAALPFPLLWLNHQTPLPVVNLYETPETLGYDRMAAVVGANEQFPHRDILVIDAGTCITYEFIDSKGQYHGGNISPGMQMRFKALASVYRTFASGRHQRAQTPDGTGHRNGYTCRSDERDGIRNFRLY